MKCYVVGAVIGGCCLVVALPAGLALPPELGSDAGPQAAGGTGRAVPPAELEPLLGAMRAADAVLDRPLTVAFEMTIPSSPLGPDRGRQTKVCRFTSCNGVRGLSVETQYEAPPAFRPPGTPGYDSMDYDSQGNLIIWHALRKLSLSTPDFNRSLDEQRMLRISPQSTTIEQIDRHLVYEYDTGSPASTYEFDQFRLATGHMAAHLQRVRSGEVRRDGLRELRCAGSYGPGMLGEWRLVVDAANGYLVREADLFREEDPDRPVIRVRNSGLAHNDAIPFGSSCVLTYVRTPNTDYVLEIRVTAVTPGTDETFLERLWERMTAPIPKDADITDYRGPTPTRYQASEAPADLLQRKPKRAP